MVAGSSAALIDELEDALARCPKHCRGLVVGEVIKLLLVQPRENVRQLTSFDEVLACLIRQAEVADIANLSYAVATSRLAFPKASRQLAFHDDASVADPILRQSSCLSDEVLIELVETRSQEQLRAISSRGALSEAVTTKLVMQGNAAVHLAISQNPGVRLTERSFAVLLKIAERDEQLAQALGKRSDIPAMLTRKFLALVTGKPRLAFLNSASPAIRALCQQEPRSEINTPIDYASAEKEIGALSRAGKLTDSTINRFAVGQDHERLVAALALLSETPVTVIERMLRADSPDELAMACKAARLRWATAASIVRSRQGGLPVSEQQLEDLRGLFESLSLSEAQRTIRFSKSDATANSRPERGKPDAKRSYH